MAVQAVENGPANPFVVLDALHLVSLDTTGLHALRQLNKAVAAKGGSLPLESLQSQPRKVIERSGFARGLAVTPSPRGGGPLRQNSCHLNRPRTGGGKGFKVARYSKSFKSRAVSRLLPPDSAVLDGQAAAVTAYMQGLKGLGLNPQQIADIVAHQRLRHAVAVALEFSLGGWGVYCSRCVMRGCSAHILAATLSKSSAA